MDMLISEHPNSSWESYNILHLETVVLEWHLEHFNNNKDFNEL